MIWLAAEIICLTAAGAPAGAVAVPSGLRERRRRERGGEQTDPARCGYWVSVGAH